MKKVQHLLIVPLLVLTGLALSACGGSVPFNFPAEAGIEEIIEGFEADELEFSGIVQVIGAEAWTISGLEIRIVEETDIDDEIVVGNFVEVEALLFGNGNLIAEEIELFDDDRDVDDDGYDDLDTSEFEFTGVVNTIAQDTWVVSSRIVAVSEGTEIEDGIAVGDMVEVEGFVKDDGTLFATEIDLSDDKIDESDSEMDVDDLDDDDDFTGIVQAITDNAWIIDGQVFAISDDTEIDNDITVGDTVEVEAQADEDGSLTALEIELEDDDLDSDSDVDDVDDDDLDNDYDDDDDEDDGDDDDEDDDNDNDDND